MLEDPQGSDFRPKNGSDGRHGRWPADDVGVDLSYREFVERVQAVLYVDRSDSSSSASYVSPQTDSMFGYSRGEWLEDPDLWVKILHPGRIGAASWPRDRARRDGGPFDAEYRLLARDGSVVWVRDQAAPVAEDEGKRSGVLLDITDRKRYEERLKKSEERFRLVAKATGEAIWDNDLTTDRQEWDGATEALFGYPRIRAGPAHGRRSVYTPTTEKGATRPRGRPGRRRRVVGRGVPFPVRRRLLRARAGPGLYGARA